MDFLFKRAQLSEADLNDHAEALRAYEEIVAIEPPGGPASQHLAGMYLTGQDYGKLAELREKQLEAASEPAFRLSLPHHLDRFACRTHLAAQTEEMVGTSGNATAVEVRSWRGHW